MGQAGVAPYRSLARSGLRASVSSDRRAQRIDEVSDRLAKVAVGNALAGVPPRRSVRAELPHTAPTSGGGGNWTKPASRTLSSEHRVGPALRPERGPRQRAPLGRSPSLHHLRRCHGRTLVRRLLRYYAIVRLPRGVHAGSTVVDLFRPTRRLTGGYPWDLPFPVRRVSTHAQGLRLRGVRGRLACNATNGVAFRQGQRRRHPGG